MSLSKIKNIILVLSGKGGVGKSSITTQLALSLSLAGHSVGVLDIDLTGPSIPRFLGIEDEKVKQAPGGWLPVEVHAPQTLASSGESSHGERVGSLHAMSLAFLLASTSTAIVWRGPKKTAMIRQFLTDVLWSDTDYLLIDTPPGTSDEHISAVETLLKNVSPASVSGPGPRLAGAVLVTTPQAVSTADVRKEINFCAKTSVPIIGVVENMSGYACPCCGEATNLFSKGGGEVMATEFGLKFLGAVPIDQHWGTLVEEGIRPEYKAVMQAETGEDEIEDSESGTNGNEANHNNPKTNGNTEEAQVETKKHQDAPLVDKYRDCSLCSLFREITAQVIETVENGTAVFVSPNAAK